jgi:hypothetical protein
MDSGLIIFERSACEVGLDDRPAISECGILQALGVNELLNSLMS